MSQPGSRRSDGQRSTALGDHVALGSTHSAVLGWTHRFACGWRRARVAAANGPRVRRIRAPSKEVHCHLNAGATNSDAWRVWVAHHVVREFAAHVQSALTSTVTENRP